MWRIWGGDWVPYLYLTSLDSLSTILILAACSMLPWCCWWTILPSWCCAGAVGAVGRGSWSQTVGVNAGGAACFPPGCGVGAPWCWCWWCAMLPWCWCACGRGRPDKKQLRVPPVTRLLHLRSHQKPTIHQNCTLPVDNCIV